MIYDEEKGIISVEKGSKSADIKVSTKPPDTVIKELPGIRPVTPAPRSEPGISRAKGPEDIHLARKKDPPELYFKSGIEYYKNQDYQNAMINFKYAAEQDIKPQYLLWLGKTYRQLDKKAQLFTIMERILGDYPESDVADDALFEIAFYYQSTQDYNNSIEKYRQLIEQYPFGVSYSNGEEFIDVARKQMQTMRGEMLSALKLLGFEGETMELAYKKFQKAHKLVVSGEGDPVTVALIKKQYAEKLKEDEILKENQKRLSEGARWCIIAGIVVIINTFLVFLVKIKIANQKTQLVQLKDTIVDLHKG